MAKLVECVPNFSEGNNKEVREYMEGLRGGWHRGADSQVSPCRTVPTARLYHASFAALCTSHYLASTKMPKGSLSSLMAPQ